MKLWQKVGLLVGLALVSMHAVDIFTFKPSAPITSACLGCVAVAIEKVIVLGLLAVSLLVSVLYYLLRNSQSATAKSFKIALVHGSLLLLGLCGLQIAYAYFFVSPRPDTIIPSRLHCLMSVAG